MAPPRPLSKPPSKAESKERSQSAVNVSNNDHRGSLQHAGKENYRHSPEKEIKEPTEVKDLENKRHSNVKNKLQVQTNVSNQNDIQFKPSETIRNKLMYIHSPYNVQDEQLKSLKHKTTQSSDDELKAYPETRKSYVQRGHVLRLENPANSDKTITENIFPFDAKKINADLICYILLSFLTGIHDQLYKY
ncbi:hypothetical protein ROZALSC1DRAFT_29745 [Rozella allomycis CSF55]|uniref:Uncharacterized protein n=1 Tax=Rozella allomycis (strain CSF55) TaxID=988480 RepID=A0A4P9YGG5_ROZAC|nr:hypothetical protein ROZALSC1DRAFT_29745 [Rozella allomycis CSF55]